MDKWLVGLKKLLNPTEGFLRHGAIGESRKMLEELWEVYEGAFYDAIEDMEGAAKATAEGIHEERMNRYLAVFYDLADARESVRAIVGEAAMEAAGGRVAND